MRKKEIRKLSHSVLSEEVCYAKLITIETSKQLSGIFIARLEYMK